MTTPVRKRFSYDRSRRLRSRQLFSAVFEAKARKNVGPLSVVGRPNDAGHSRLGLSVSRAVGTAVQRNRIKRLIREAFRLSQHDWPRGYDLVVVVKPHKPATLAEYQKMLFGAVRSLHLEWERRGGKTQDRRSDPAS